MGLLEKVVERATATKTPSRSISTVDDYAGMLSSYMFNNSWYTGGVQQTLMGEPAEYVEPGELTAYAQQMYASNGPVFALMAVRMMCFSAIRFQWQQISNGRPNRIFGSPELGILEIPWVGGTTQDLLVKMIVDVDLCGNAYIARVRKELVRLRPDWVKVILGPRIVDPKKPNQVAGLVKVAYAYREGGFYGNSFLPEAETVLFLPEEIAHFAPYTDPLNSYRGMSWLTPVIRSTTNDKLMETHQTKFFENGATPNMIVSMDPTISFETFKKFKAEFNLDHKGVENAYKTLFMGGGADVTVVGSDFSQMSFTSVQGRGETRLASAAGVPVTIVGFSEGLQGSSLNAGNFGQARRRLADITMHPLWSLAAGCLQGLLKPPPGSVRLWYDARDVPFLREDSKDAAEIMQIRAAVLNGLIQAGWTQQSAKDAVLADDFSGLEHTGLLSVQLQPPGTVATPTGATPATPPTEETK